MSPPSQILRHAARDTLSKIRRRSPPTHTTLRHTSATPHLLAQPSHFVTGVTPEQLQADAVLQEWFASNFKSWQSDPENIIVPDVQAEKEAADAQVEESSNGIAVPPELASRNIRPLVGYIRLSGREEGSRNCYDLRNPGPNEPFFPLVPGILHGSDPTQNILSHDASSKVLVKTPWFEIQRELDRYHRRFTNRVYALTLYDANEADVSYHRSAQNKPEPTYQVCQDTMTITEVPPPPPPVLPDRTPILENVLVIPADLQLHPVAHAAYCLNFVRYHANKPIKLPIVSVNEEESPAMKRGGFIAYTSKTIECLVDEGAPIPEGISLECTGLRQKDVVRRDRLVMPEGCVIHPRVREDFLLGTVFGAKGGGGDADGEGAEADAKK